MQDNYSNIDDESLESGWEHMRSLLDKEMPIKDDRRAYFWYFASGLFVLSMIAFFIWNQSEIKLSEPADSSAIPVASIIKDQVPLNTNPSGVKGAQEALLPIHESSLNIKDVVMPNSKASLVDVVPNTFSEQNEIAQVSSSVLFEAEQIEKTGIVKQREIIAHSTQHFDVSDSKAKMSDYSLILKAVASNEVSFESVAHIPSLELNQIALNEVHIKPISFDDPIKFRQASPLSLGMQASYVLGNMLAYEGVSIGLVSKFKLNRKFSIRSGVDLSFFKSQHNIKSWFRNNDSALMLEERVISKSSSSAGEILKSVDKSTLLELPIEVEYKLMPILSISTGLKLGYLLNASGDNLHLSDDNPPSVKINDTYPLDEGFIQRPYLSVKTGAHYSLTPELNLDLSYTQSLGSFVSDKVVVENEAYDRNISNNRKNAFSYLSMGLSYEF